MKIISPRLKDAFKLKRYSDARDLATSDRSKNNKKRIFRCKKCKILFEVGFKTAYKFSKGFIPIQCFACYSEGKKEYDNEREEIITNLIKEHKRIRQDRDRSNKAQGITITNEPECLRIIK